MNERHIDALMSFWFGDIDDATPHDRSQDPFKRHFMRWYGKDAAIDEEIRTRFEPLLQEVTGDGRRWETIMQDAGGHPDGLVALTILLDQLPRNMYRGTARMYDWDALGLVVSERAREQRGVLERPLVQQMFLGVPLMHAESTTLQQRMLAYFERLVDQARARCPHNEDFFSFALAYAARHVDVVERFGRFPHRNTILSRDSTSPELGFLLTDAAYF